MTTTRRSVLAAAGAAAAGARLLPQARATESNGTGGGSASTGAGEAVIDLLRRSATANAALMRGDIAGYRSLVTLTEDFTLMSPFGGAPSHGRDITEDSWQAMGRFFSNGTLEQEPVQTYAVADMVVLAVIERARVEVGGLPAQEWPLRVTLVYRRDGAQWRLAHRHADPLVAGVSLEQAAALARGERLVVERDHPACVAR